MTSNISWLHRPGYKPEVWNFVTGCTRVSEGCRNCYAEAVALRFGMSRFPWDAQHAPANVTIRLDRMDKPLHWRTPRMVFVDSMSDLWHSLVLTSLIQNAFRVMAQCPQHIFIILTKRPMRAANWGITGWGSWPANVWLGVSIESERTLWRLPVLRMTGAKVKLVSFEPLLGPIDRLDLTGIDWAIVGGESGNHFRPMEMAWARSIRDAAQRAGAAFFFKQTAGRYPGRGALQEEDGSHWLWHQWPGDLYAPVPVMPRPGKVHHGIQYGDARQQKALETPIAAG